MGSETAEQQKSYAVDLHGPDADRAPRQRRRTRRTGTPAGGSRTCSAGLVTVSRLPTERLWQLMDACDAYVDAQERMLRWAATTGDFTAVMVTSLRARLDQVDAAVADARRVLAAIDTAHRDGQVRQADH